jgi:hypothetical protein
MANVLDTDPYRPREVVGGYAPMSSRRAQAGRRVWSAQPATQRAAATRLSADHARLDRDRAEFARHRPT